MVRHSGLGRRRRRGRGHGGRLRLHGLPCQLDVFFCDFPIPQSPCLAQFPGISHVEEKEGEAPNVLHALFVLWIMGKEKEKEGERAVTYLSR